MVVGVDSQKDVEVGPTESPAVTFPGLCLRTSGNFERLWAADRVRMDDPNRPS